MGLVVAEVLAIAGTADMVRLHQWHPKGAEADEGSELDTQVIATGSSRPERRRQRRWKMLFSVDYQARKNIADDALIPEVRWQTSERSCSVIIMVDD